MQQVFTFDNSGYAYDACQCRDELGEKGTILLIPSEKVVGLADAWPVAVTVECGKLHEQKPEYDPAETFPREACVAAVELAEGLGWEIAPAFQRFAAKGPYVALRNLDKKIVLDYLRPSTLAELHKDLELEHEAEPTAELEDAIALVKQGLVYVGMRG